jgi:hypothetical protein
MAPRRGEAYRPHLFRRSPSQQRGSLGSGGQSHSARQHSPPSPLQGTWHVSTHEQGCCGLLLNPSWLRTSAGAHRASLPGHASASCLLEVGPAPTPGDTVRSKPVRTANVRIAVFTTSPNLPASRLEAQEVLTPHGLGSGLGTGAACGVTQWSEEMSR